MEKLSALAAKGFLEDPHNEVIPGFPNSITRRQKRPLQKVLFGDFNASISQLDNYETVPLAAFKSPEYFWR